MRVTPEAEADIAQARDWYEQAQAGLGEHFLAAIEEAADLIANNPELFAPIHADMRRVLLHVFPYALFYVLEHGDVIILGCFHGRRDPRAWRNRGLDYREV